MLINTIDALLNLVGSLMQAIGTTTTESINPSLLADGGRIFENQGDRLNIEPMNIPVDKPALARASGKRERIEKRFWQFPCRFV